MGDILIAEDDPLSQRIIGKTLQKLGHTYRIVSSGDKAIEILKTHPPELLLLDVYLPEINGIEVLKKLRATNKATRVIMMTASLCPHIRSEALELGCSCFVVKPLPLSSLKQCIEDALKGSSCA